MSELSTRNDADIVREVVAGGTAAYEMLVARYLPLVYGIAYAKTGNSSVAEELTQETFVRAYSNLNSLKTPASFRSWLMAIVRNLATSSIAKRSREVTLTDTIASNLADEQSDHEREDEKQAVREQLAMLDDQPREVLLLHYFTGMRTRDIAGELGISQDAVKKRLQRARGELAHRLSTATGTNVDAQQRIRRRVMAVLPSVSTGFSSRETIDRLDARAARKALDAIAAKPAKSSAVFIACALLVVVPAYVLIAERTAGPSSDSLLAGTSSPTPEASQLAAAPAEQDDEASEPEPDSLSERVVPEAISSSVAGAQDEALGVILGNVTYDGEPVPGVRIRLKNGQGDTVASVNASENGDYMVPDLPAGEYDVKVYNPEEGLGNDEPSSISSLRRLALVEGGLQTIVDLEYVRGTAQLAGYVSIEGDLPRALNVYGWVYASTGDYRFNTEDLAEGGFLAVGLPAGQAKVRVRATGKDGSIQARDIEVSLRTGKEHGFEVNFVGGASIFGVVDGRIEGGNQGVAVLPGNVRLPDPDNLDADSFFALQRQLIGDIVVESDGTYRMDNLAPGKYLVSAYSAPGTEAEAFSQARFAVAYITVVDGVAYELNFDLSE